MLKPKTQEPMLVLIKMRAFSAGVFMLGCNQSRLHKIFPLAIMNGKTRRNP